MSDEYWTTTDYGTWCNHGDHMNVSVEASIADAVSGASADWHERMEAAGAFDRIAEDYREAINEALPERVSLLVNEFIGPRRDEDCPWEGDLDIAAVVESVALQPIIERHDIDLQGLPEGAKG